MRGKELLCEREGDCEVVQRGERIRIHPALHGRGCVRAFLRHPGERLPLAERRRDGRVRSAQRPQGLSGGQRRARGINFSHQFANPLGLSRGFFIWAEKSALEGPRVSFLGMYCKYITQHVYVPLTAPKESGKLSLCIAWTEQFSHS